jgi:Fur family ferric uptake transcriptional regulator
MINHSGKPPSRPEIAIFKHDGASARAGGGWRKEIFEKFNAHLAEQGLKLTHQRHIILTHLLDAKVHMAADELFAALKTKDPTLGKATVFRTLNLLENAGIVARVLKADGKPHFEVNLLRPHHDHAICIECGAIQEIKSDKIEQYQNEAVAKLGFVPLWHRHEVFGRCRGCAGKR